MSTVLHTEFYPCSGSKAVREPLVLVHGWGNDSRVWQPLLSVLAEQLDVITLDLPGFGQSPPCASWQQAVELMAAVLPPRFALLGWSLGGVVAVQLAAQYPERVSKLTTIASNAVFVRRSDWNCAMAVDVADQFSQNFTVDSAAAMKQFTALEAMGDDDEKKLLRWLRQNMAEINFPSWLQALGWLDEMDNRQSLVAMNTPMLAIFGENDQLVPVSAAQSVAALNSSIRIVVMPGTGHAPHLSQPDKVAELVLDWVSAPDPYCLRKELIAASFGRAADSYDAFAQLQRDVGDQLMELIPDGLEPEAIADMGCGTGYFSAELANRYPQSSCLGVDLAEGMLSYGADHHRGFANLSWLCGDAESLPLRDGSFELIFSNFAFQWCQSPQALMAEQWRLLKPGGWLIFTTVGPGTLAELRAAWQLVDHYIHVNQFIQLDAVDTALKSAGFAIHQWQEQTLVRHHPQLSALTRELKAIGAHNVNTGRNNGLTGRRHIEALKAAYENFRTPEGLPSTWEILYVAARKVCQ